MRTQLKYASWKADPRILFTVVVHLQFGEVDIDGSLVAAQTAGAEDIMMLNNGCLCCTVRGDLVRMIGELVNKKKGKFDHIVIETTGEEFIRLL